MAHIPSVEMCHNFFPQMARYSPPPTVWPDFNRTHSVDGFHVNFESLSLFVKKLTGAGCVEVGLDRNSFYGHEVVNKN